MKVFKPDWIHHDGMSICSIDIHPDGSRVATGGQGESSGRIMIWNMAPVVDEAVEKDESVPKMLCQLDNHLACVNCVRWSYSGRFLASGGDDKLVMIWAISKSLGSNTVFGSKGKVNVEGWKCVHTLRLHSGDVLDLAWSESDRWLATCSIDNTIIVWQADNFPEVVTILKGHTGLVKGVSWDPVGKYLGSQSDDRTVRIWRTSDWSTEAVIKKPFEHCTATTMVLRLSWSPDGQLLVTAHAMNGTGPTAQIIERNGWEHSKDMVGHGKAVTCVRYSPVITEGMQKGKTSCTCALGSRDMSISIWMSTAKRPLAVLKDLFSTPVLDLGWSSKGHSLMACSADGSTVYIEFSAKEMGKPISDFERRMMLEELYGKVQLGRSNDLLMIENPEILAQVEKLKDEVYKKDETRLDGKTNKTDQKNGKPEKKMQVDGDDVPVANGSSQLASLESSSNFLNCSNNLEHHSESNAPKKQIETRTSDGRRRITPIFIPLNVDNCNEIAPFCADNSSSQFSSSRPTKTRIVIEKRDDVIVAPNVTTPVKSATQGGSTPSKCSTPTPNNTLTQSPKVEPLPSSTNPFSSLNANAERPSKHSTTAPKRPRTLTLGRSPKKKRPKDAKETNPTSSSAVYGVPLNILPPLVLSSTRHIKLSKTRNYIDVENGASKGSAGQLSVVKMFLPDNVGKPQWELAIGADVCGCVGTSDWVALACTDATLRFVDARRGTHLVPPVTLGAPPALLTYSAAHVVSMTTSGAFTMWRVAPSEGGLRPEAALSPHSLASLVPPSPDLRVRECFVNETGEPVVAFSCGKAFLYSTALRNWLLIANSSDPVMRSTHLSYRGSLRTASPAEPLPLKSIQTATLNGLNASAGRVSVGSEFGPLCTLSYLDTQMSSARALNSKPEYKFWFSALVRFLVQHGLNQRLRSLCEDLLGPTFSSANSRLCRWEPQVLGFDKHELLREVLREMSSNLKLQRLSTEIFAQLETVAVKRENSVD